MREFEFRGIAVEELVSESQWLNDGFGIHTVKYVDGKEECYLYTWNGVYEVTKESVGQYTGLKDKEGKKLYEGDIYHMGDPNITYTVVWHDCGLIGKQNGSSSYAGLNHWQDKIEIIGNIHEEN